MSLKRIPREASHGGHGGHGGSPFWSSELDARPGGICEVWVIDVIRRRVSVHLQPNQGHYQTRLELAVDDGVTVEAFPNITLPVNIFLRPKLSAPGPAPGKR